MHDPLISLAINVDEARQSLVVAISKSMIIFLSNLLLIFSEVGELKFGLLDKTLPSARRSTLWKRKVRLIVTF